MIDFKDQYDTKSMNELILKCKITHNYFIYKNEKKYKIIDYIDIFYQRHTKIYIYNTNNELWIIKKNKLRKKYLDYN